jgi:hypothetical protein
VVPRAGIRRSNVRCVATQSFNPFAGLRQQCYTVLLHKMNATDQPFKVHPSLSKKRDYAEAVAEVERELGIRSRCYERWVQELKISRIDATDRLERLRAALAFMVDPDRDEPAVPATDPSAAS